MAVTDRTSKFGARASFGNFRSVGGTRNIVAVSYGYTDYKKRPAAASATAILAATAVATAGQTISTGFTQPDVARAISVVVAAGTAADIAAGTIVVTGTNVEGKVITENFVVTADTAATITGAKAFKTITSIAVPVQDGSSTTVGIGTRNLLGLRHRLTSGATIKVVTQSSTGTRALQAAPTTSAQSTTLVESNTVTPATLPDGTLTFSIHYIDPIWTLDPTNANPVYGTTVQ